jgi:tyrosine-protein kinase Etk/Wzc
MKPRYDLIILDTPPIGMVTDAQIISPFSDIVLYIIRQRYTFKNQLNIVNNLSKSGKMQNIYLVLNDVQQRKSYKYGYGSGYGAGYGYYDEGSTKKKKSKKTIA